MVGTPNNSLISTYISLVGSFRQHFRYQIRFSPVIVVLVVRIVLNHLGVHIWVCQAEVAILNQLNLLDIVEC